MHGCCVKWGYASPGLVCEVCWLTFVWVDCRCFLPFVFLGGARRLELSLRNTEGGVLLGSSLLWFLDVAGLVLPSPCNTAGGHASGNVVPQAVSHCHSKHVNAECHAAVRDGGQESPSGPSGRATEPGSAALPLDGVEVKT